MACMRVDGFPLADDGAIVRGAGRPVARAVRPVRLLTVVLTAATLAACANSSTPRYTSTGARSAVAARTPAPVTTDKAAAANAGASHGVASFYSHGGRTASGQMFDPQELTAAHRTLPFGTQLRVTNLTNGRTVTVRVNDRGPFIPGRVVDVSRSAAQSLGMVERGVTKVKLDVVE
jgi:rare lipoprotein A